MDISPKPHTAVPHDQNKDSDWTLCYLGLGSNLDNELGSPRHHVETAIGQLQQHPAIRAVQPSSLYASAPMGPQDQPDFINAVVALQTTLDPWELLALCQQLEQQAKRQKLRRWGERSLDVDILLYGSIRMDEPTLTIPHKGLTARNFVLIPLLEVAPNLQISGLKLTNLAASQDWTGLKRMKPAQAINAADQTLMDA